MFYLLSKSSKDLYLVFNTKISDYKAIIGKKNYQETFQSDDCFLYSELQKPYRGLYTVFYSFLKHLD